MQRAQHMRTTGGQADTITYNAFASQLSQHMRTSGVHLQRRRTTVVATRADEWCAGHRHHLNRRPAESVAAHADGGVQVDVFNYYVVLVQLPQHLWTSGERADGLPPTPPS